MEEIEREVAWLMQGLYSKFINVAHCRLGVTSWEDHMNLCSSARVIDAFLVFSLASSFLRLNCESASGLKGAKGVKGTRSQIRTLSLMLVKWPPYQLGNTIRLVK
jgi:hypothetical protein